MAHRPHLSFWQIVNMNVGFFGIQFSFGLQQSSMSPIYKYLGADEATLPLLWLAGPVTGLLVQPLVGAMSDRTVTRWGRRTPYFLIGALLCSLGLLAMPFSPTLWMAASLLWILDAANNVTMEPYRAFVSDKLAPSQHSLGFLTQSAFTGLGQTLAYLTPSLLVLLGMDKDATNGSHIPQVVVAAFLLGAFMSIASVLWSIRTTPEDPPAVIEGGTRPGLRTVLADVVLALRDMPDTMRRLALVKLFQWYAMFCYWQYIMLALARTVYGTSDPASAGFRDAGLLNGQIGAFYNFVAFIAAFALVPFTRRYGPKVMHSVCVALAGIGMLCIPLIREPALLFLPMIGIGLAWASMMGNPYVMLAGCIPPERTGVYMGIFNMFIVLPMIVQIFTLPLLYGTVLGGDPANVIRLAGVLMLCAAVAVLRVKLKPAQQEADMAVPLPAARH
ncbi:maltose/moltooligosaccharide transporter [Pseudoduganella flava]|uniref:MFS transporter n=1 Tax=Pseudoduganella flava TaxID=871742 RepID=A0A562Q3F0_9BURK|nr:MFS transporter [Pseudoduganella flava]QGZ41321.1 MFS transporter [Pseudoduganella flava]TWI51265.1 maltose/moltooligosaccharide transporter [Pseudoduganella flava]